MNTQILYSWKPLLDTMHLPSTRTKATTPTGLTRSLVHIRKAML